MSTDVLKPTTPRSASPDEEPGGVAVEGAGTIGRWARGTPWVIVVAAFALNGWAADRSGDANSYYAVAVQSMARSWHNFFFASFDQGGFITVDKPPFAFWVQALSVKVFGYSSWSILLPEAAAGAAAVGLLYLAVRRVWGRAAGLIAALALAVTPVSVAVNRDNNPDAMLVFLAVAAAYALTRAIESGRMRWLLGTAVLVGLGFNTKMLAAFIVVPGLWAAYLVAGRYDWKKRVAQLVAATGVLVVVAGSWMTVVDLIPAGSRPYVGGSTNNTARDLAFGYNGFGRVDGQSQGPGGRGGRFRFGGANRRFLGPVGGPGANGRLPAAPANPTGGAAGAGGFPRGGGPGGAGGANSSFGGTSGLTRLTNDSLADQVSWLIPLAAIGGLAALVVVAIRRRRDAHLGSLLMWGGWAAACAAVFSLSKGIFHPYYVSLLAPAIAALSGIGLVTFAGALGSRRVMAVIGGLTVALTGVAEIVIARRVDYAPWLRTVVGVGAVAAGIALALRAMPTGYVARLARRFHLAGVGGAAAVLLLLPAAWAWNGTRTPTAGVFPSARPAGSAPAGLPGGVPGGGFAARFGGGIAPPRSSASARNQGVIGGFDTSQSGLVDYLERHRGGATWIVAVASSNQAAPLSLLHGDPVMAYGGFNGTDPALTRAKLADLVRTGKLRYILANGQQIGALAGRTPKGGADVSALVTSSCKLVKPPTYGQPSATAASGLAPRGFGAFGGGRGSGSLYDCKDAAVGLARASS